VRQDESRPLDRLDHLRHGERLAAAGDAQQHLVPAIVAQTATEPVDRLRLVPLRPR
jgi:hypothetical protein